MRKYSYILSWFLFLIGFSSCRKVVDMDLNSASPQLVIEGNITDEPGSCKVKLTKTVNFSETNIFPSVSGAVVSIHDDLGNSETLTETSPGIYTGNGIQGAPGRIYTLAVISNGKNYSAVSKMPYPVKIDTLTVEKSIFGGEKIISMQFRDSAGIKNYYRFVELVNGIPNISIFTIDDNLEDGENISYPFFSQDTLVAGDSVTVLLQSIDKNVYMYFNTLNQISNGGGDQSSSPANPVSNINNGALGYFSAYSVRSKRVVVP